MLEVEVPARVEYVSLLRMLVSTFAASHSGLDDDRLDDLRLALSEACNLVVGGGAPSDGRVLVVECRDTSEALVLDVHDGRSVSLPEPDDVGSMPAPEHLDSDADLPLELIRALVDEVDRTVHDGSQALRLTMRFAA